MSPRYSTVRADSIDYAFWLIFKADGSMRFARGEPTIQRGERAMGVTAVLPKSLFRTPVLTARIGVQGEEGDRFQIDVKAASEALSAAIGCDVDLRIRETSE